MEAKNIRTIVVGTRQSALALQQTGHVVADLQQLCLEHQLPYQFECKKIVTRGDQILDVSLSKVGGKGLFVKEIEQAMLDNEIDIAVHSMKDMPAELPEGLIIGAVPVRQDARDALISRNGVGLAQLPIGATVGTSSLRRASQLLAVRPDLHIVPLRGNIDTRLRKLETEELDAIVLAAAGLARMGWLEQVSEYLSIEECLPAVAQGALGIQCRVSDTDVTALLDLYNHQSTAQLVAAERTLLAELNGGCQVPLAAYAVWYGEPLYSDICLTAAIASVDGSRLIRHSEQGRQPTELGRTVAASLRRLGADELLQPLKG
jgi:hydroxymethylbilane synthase